MIEEAMTRAHAGRLYNGNENQFLSRFILHPKLTNPNPPTEKKL